MLADRQRYRSFYVIVALFIHLPRPDLLLYLKTPVPILLERIQQRGRAMEQGISADYLSLLEQFYEEWLAHFDLCPVLTIHTEKLDFVQNPTHLDLVVQKIKAKLAGKEEIYLG